MCGIMARTAPSASGPGRVARGDVPGGRAWLIFGLGAAAYAIAVLGRTTLSVAGLDAVAHFQSRAGIVATFVVVQLLVYTAMQLPAGVLLDRLGSRRMITAGLATMGVGQLVMAFAESVPVAILARVILGAGDAFVFGSAIRLLPRWFPPERVPVLTQVTGLLGQSGQLLSAMPFAWLLGEFGWRVAFGVAAAIALAGAVIAAVLVQDGPGAAPSVPRPPRRVGLRAQVRPVLRHPATWLGIWTHWSTCFATMTFGMMWGFPYLTQGEGRSRATAGALLGVLVVVGALWGPVLGWLTGRHPLRRSNLALAMVAAGALPWLAVLLWPGPAPLWLLVVLCAGLSMGGPGSAIGFDFTRTSTPSHRMGTANGLVIMGGFVAATVAVLLIGVVLDLQSPTGNYTLGQFRLAMAVHLPLYAIGVVGIYVARGRTRRLMANRGMPVPSWPEALRREWRRRKRAAAAYSARGGR